MRTAEAKSEVASGLDTTNLRPQLQDLSHPKSPSSALKKVGLALTVGVPDPVTAIPGVALLAASYASKKNDPAKLADLALETRKILRDLRSLSL